MADPGVYSPAVVADQLRVDFGAASHRQLDATGGRLDLAPSSLDVVSLTLVGLPRPPAEIAAAVDLAEGGGFVHGTRWGVIDPADGAWRVAILTVDDADARDSRVDVGRLSERDVARWAPALDGRTVRVAVFVEATPGFAGVEVRFVRGIVEGTRAPAALMVSPTPDELDAVTPPPVAPDWYIDPEVDSLYRWWDGSSWTTHTAPR